MMHGSAFDRFADDDDEFEEGYAQRNGSAGARPRRSGGGGGVGEGGGGGYRIVREERRERRTKDSSPRRQSSGGRRNVSPRRKAQTGRYPASTEHTTERVHRVRSSPREPSPRRRRDRHAREEYYDDEEPVVQRTKRSSRTTTSSSRQNANDYGPIMDYGVDELEEPVVQRTKKSSRTTTSSSRQYANDNGPIMDYGVDDLGDDFQTVKVSRSQKGQREADGVQRSESGRSSRSRNGVVPAQVEEHMVEYEDDDQFDADLQYIRKPSPRMGGGMMAGMGKMKGGKKFLRDVQDELEEQRTQWEDEVDKLSHGTLLRGVPKTAQAEGTNSFVDMSTGSPIFKAFFDVSEFPRRGIAVSVDKIQNKIIVKGGAQSGATGTLTKTFTQKVQLPKFADDQRMRTKLARNGILKVELPLIYYFPGQKGAAKKPRSFVNEIRTRRDGTQVLEILANAGTDVKARDLKVNVTEENELVITHERATRGGKVTRNTVKRYTLPSFADLDNITSKLGKDGRLVVRVPLKRKAIHDP